MTTDEENERMLKVIEGEPTWQENLQSLVPAIYSLAIANTLITISHKRRFEEGVC